MDMTETPKDAAHRLAKTILAQGFKPQALHEYQDADGNSLYWRIRAKHPDGRKWIRPMRSNGNGYELGELKFSSGKPLYRLPDIATNPDATIFVTEGENCCDALAKLGLVSTTSGGSDSASAADWAALKGRQVTIWPDKDTSGLNYANAVSAALKDIAASVSIIDVEALGLPEKGDAVDWLQANPDASADSVLSLRMRVLLQVTEEWSDPEPLPEGLPPVAELELKTIPDPLRGWIMDVAERMQIPPDFSAAATIVALGSLIGRKVGIHPKRRDDWLVVPNLWGAIIGRPSLMKSPAVSEAMKPLNRLINEANEAHKAAMNAYEIESEIAVARKETRKDRFKKAARDNNETEIRNLKNSVLEEPVKPTLRRYRTNDPTVEKLGEILLENPQGILVYRDELSGWLRNLDKQGREGDREFYLESWNGTANGYTVDRIGRGTLSLPALCISVFGGIQPGPLSNYIYKAAQGGSGDDGLIQRFQMTVWPDAPTAWKKIDRWPNSAARDRAYDIFDRLDKRDLGTMQSGDELPTVRFSDEGQELFDQWHEKLELRLRGDEIMSPALESHLAKYRSLMPSLALIFHLIDVAESSVVIDAVSLNHAVLAAEWCDYLESHAERLYACAEDPAMGSARELLRRIRTGKIQTGCAPRDIYRNGWSRLAQPEDVQAAINLLADFGWVRRHRTKTAGREAEIIELHPTLRNAA